MALVVVLLEPAAKWCNLTHSLLFAHCPHAQAARVSTCAQECQLALPSEPAESLELCSRHFARLLGCARSALKLKCCLHTDTR